jgi:hypothetical protein
MNAKPTFFGVVVVTALCTGAVAIANVGDSAVIHDQNGGTTPQAVSPAGPEIRDAFAVFRDPNPSSHPVAEQTLRDILGATSPSANGPVGTADFGKASSSAIEGSSMRAWIVPSGDMACLVLSDTVDGYGASCATLTDIAAGRGYLALGPPAGSQSQTATVAVMVPDDGVEPEIQNADGSRTVLRRDGNVAAAVVRIDTGAMLVTGPESTPLSAFRRPEK